MACVDIRPGVLRDVSFVIANMREQDKAEAYCQLPEGTKAHELAYGLLMGSKECYVAYLKDHPVATFGICQGMSIASLVIWALGTDRMTRVIPAITRFVVTDVMRRAIDAGHVSMEARSIATHHAAHRWMKATGAQREGKPYPFGRNGELFATYRWTVYGYHKVAERYGARAT